MKPIATLTLNPALDVTTEVDKVEANRKLRCAPERRDPGGGGINVARAVTLLGGEAVALYPRGGETGHNLESLLADQGVPQRAVPVAGAVREDFTVRETASGASYRFVLPGPELSQPEWQACLDALEDLEPRPDYLVASGSLPRGVPEDIYARVADRARELGIRLILDSSGQSLRAALERGLFLVRTNLREFQELLGTETDSDDQLEQRARQFVAQGGAEVVVVTLKDRGALLAAREGSWRVTAPKVEVVSPSGAGDCFVAALTLALARGEDYPTALGQGMAGASAAMLTPGTELLRREDMERLVQEMAE